MEKAARAWALAGGKPAIVLGRSQHGLQVVPLLPVRRHASGGGAMLAGPWLLRAAVRLPRSHVLLRHGPVSLARWMGGIHLGWLQAEGLVGAHLHEGPTLEHWACFAGRSAGEVLLDGRKLTGIAQCWQRAGVLVIAGTLMDPPPWHVLCNALQRPAPDAAHLLGVTTSLRERLDSSGQGPAWAEGLRTALHLGLAACSHPATCSPSR